MVNTTTAMTTTINHNNNNNVHLTNGCFKSSVLSEKSQFDILYLVPIKDYNIRYSTGLDCLQKGGKVFFLLNMCCNLIYPAVNVHLSLTVKGLFAFSFYFIVAMTFVWACVCEM